MDEDDKTLYKNKVYEILNNKRDKSKRLNLIKNIFEKYTKEGYDVICITGSSKAYKWDMSENKIKTIMAVAHTDLGVLKLSDVVKRLLSETD